MTPHSLTAVILVAGMVVVGWGIVWHERMCGRRVARRQHPSNWAPETDAAIDEAMRLVGLTLADEAEAWLRDREPGRH